MCVPAAILVGSFENFRLGVRRIERTRWRLWLAYAQFSDISMKFNVHTYLAHAFSRTISHSPQLAKVTGRRQCLIYR